MLGRKESYVLLFRTTLFITHCLFHKFTLQLKTFGDPIDHVNFVGSREQVSFKVVRLNFLSSGIQYIVIFVHEETTNHLSIAAHCRTHTKTNIRGLKKTTSFCVTMFFMVRALIWIGL